MREKILQTVSAACGAVTGFFCGLPPVLWVLTATMTLDYVSGILTAIAGKSTKTQSGGISSKAAFSGLWKKLLIFAVVALAFLLDEAIALTAGTSPGLAPVSGAACLWFIASEGISILENSATLGVPIPGFIRRTLDILQKDKNGEN